LKSLSVLKEQSGIIILLLTKMSSLIVPIILNADNEFLRKLLFSLVIFSLKSYTVKYNSLLGILSLLLYIYFFKFIKFEFKYSIFSFCLIYHLLAKSYLKNPPLTNPFKK
jgi:hypothetical protein